MNLFSIFRNYRKRRTRTLDMISLSGVYCNAIVAWHFHLEREALARDVEREWPTATLVEPTLYDPRTEADTWHRIRFDREVS